MITGEGQPRGLEKERIDKRYPAAANKDMECPASFCFLGKWLGITDVGMGDLSAQQAQEPTSNQSDIYAAANAYLGRISFGDVHEHSANYATEKSPS